MTTTLENWGTTGIQNIYKGGDFQDAFNLFVSSDTTKLKLRVNGVDVDRDTLMKIVLRDALRASSITIQNTVVVPAASESETEASNDMLAISECRLTTMNIQLERGVVGLIYRLQMQGTPIAPNVFLRRSVVWSMNLSVDEDTSTQPPDKRRVFTVEAIRLERLDILDPGAPSCLLDPSLHEKPQPANSYRPRSHDQHACGLPKNVSTIVRAGHIIQKTNQVTWSPRLPLLLSIHTAITMSAGWPDWGSAAIVTLHTASNANPATHADTLAARALVNTASDTSFDSAFDAFVAKSAEIVVNNENKRRDDFKADIRQDVNENAMVTILNSVDVQEHQDDALVEPEASVIPSSFMG
ncbi:hypothetical protein EVG20_g10447 [Dentipellis fragilis]|uniref:Uncharacterized protein n=1 Tax=Dentipellis fragilis TaxID=205917 RepID=A0A4Y9XSF3_9AGAM|nr:hypothetical protein EVG20_g10447 [Dentipellis fragilis]